MLPYFIVGCLYWQNVPLSSLFTGTIAARHSSLTLPLRYLYETEYRCQIPVTNWLTMVRKLQQRYHEPCTVPGKRQVYRADCTVDVCVSPIPHEDSTMRSNMQLNLLWCILALQWHYRYHHYYSSFNLLVSVNANTRGRGWNHTEFVPHSFPRFEHYLDIRRGVRGGNFSLNEDHMRFFIHPDNTPPHPGNGTVQSVQGEHAAGFHNVSLFGAIKVCVIWSHASTEIQTAGWGLQDVSYFGIAKQLEWVYRNTTEPTIRYKINYRLDAHNFDNKKHCFEVEQLSELNETYGVGVGAECISRREEFVDVRVWRLWKEMKDRKVQHLYPIDCPAGTVPAKRNVSCKICPPGTVSKASNKECHTCGSGWIPNRFKDGCIPCKSYEYSSINDNFCRLCKPGHIPSEARDTCTQCAKSQVSRQHDIVCHTCVAGKIPTTTQYECVACANYEYSGVNDSGCFPCGFGNIPSMSQDSCSMCADYQISPFNASACSACPNGTVPNIDQSECDRCPSASVAATNDSSCSICPAGSVPDQLRSRCLSCSPGRFALANQTFCLECPPGQYSEKAGSSECDLCKQHRYQPLSGQKTCYSCSGGRYQFMEGQTTCVSWKEIDGLISVQRPKRYVIW